MRRELFEVLLERRSHDAEGMSKRFEAICSERQSGALVCGMEDGGGGGRGTCGEGGLAARL